jgi:uncharacterized protein with GYD domain
VLASAAVDRCHDAAASGEMPGVGTFTGGDVPKFLIKASYTAEGARGLIKEGGTGRRDAVRKMIESLGGKVEAFYYAFGDDDVYVISDVPNTVDGLALTLAVNASGAVRLTTVPLITAEEIDAAAKKAVSYRAPGA